ncbi:MAG: hypothetical protein Q9163_004695 [Psora crenata]
MVGEGGYRQINKTLNACAFDQYLASQQSHIPRLQDVEKISPLVIRVLGQNPGKACCSIRLMEEDTNFTLQGTNTWIVGNGSHRLLIDTGQGIPEWADIISATLAAHNITLSHVLLTHWHGDHTGGVPDLLQLYPFLTSSIYKNSPGRGQQPIADGEVFRVEGATIRAVHSPGHSHDHMCFILEEENALFTGDNVLGHGSSAVEELDIYMKSLRVMQAEGCAIGYPAHGDVLPDLPAKLSGEIAQKLRRERQVLQGLDRIRERQKRSGQRGKGSVTVKELVTEIHGDGINEGVSEMVLEPFIDEVLGKLAADGKVGFELHAGSKKWFAVGATLRMYPSRPSHTQ